MQGLNNLTPKKLIIYYFSGIGNAKKLSTWIANVSGNYEYNSKIVDIGNLKSRRIIEIENDTIIGICSPTHGFNFPPIMFHIILWFPRSKNNKLFK
ncbi:MAG: hypothetical protein AB7S50_04675 [Bacteroidales bacterium]